MPPETIDDTCPKGTESHPHHWCGNVHYACVECGVKLNPERCDAGCGRQLYPEQMHAGEGQCVDCRERRAR